MNQLVIPFSVEGTEYPKLFFGEKQRYSSMTSVAFINEHLLACASYCMHELYLVRFDLPSKMYEVLDSIETTGGADNESGPTDILCYRQQSDGRHILLASDFNNCSVTLYEVLLSDHKLKHLRSIWNRGCGFCHGVSFYPNDEDVLFFTTSGTTNPLCGVYGIRCSEEEHPLPFFAMQETGWLAKDVTFVDDNMMVAAFCNSAPDPNEQRFYDTKLVVYQVDVQGNKSRPLDEFLLPQHHVDSVIYKDENLYATVEGAEQQGRVMVFKVDRVTGKLQHKRDIDGFFFPHGVDVLPQPQPQHNLIAVSEYGNSTVIIRNLLR